MTDYIAALKTPLFTAEYEHATQFFIQYQQLDSTETTAVVFVADRGDKRRIGHFTSETTQFPSPAEIVGYDDPDVVVTQKMDFALGPIVSVEVATTFPF